MAEKLSVYVDQTFFSEEEVDLFLKRHEAFSEDNWLQAGLYKKGFDPSVRKTKAKEIVFNKNDPFIAKLLCGVVKANEDIFNLNVIRYCGEVLTLLKYESDNNHFSAHSDSVSIPGEKTRRALTAIVILSNPQEYKGGQLVFYPDFRRGGPIGVRRRFDVKKGTLTVFPSTMFHAVLPVTDGTRFSLVMWSHEENKDE